MKTLFIKLLFPVFLFFLFSNLVFGQAARSNGSAQPAPLPELLLSNGHTNQVEAIDFSPDGKYLVTGGVDTTVKIWKIETGDELRSFTGHRQLVIGVKWSKNSKQIISVDLDGEAIVWEAASGSIVRRFKVLEQGSVSNIAISKNEQLLATAGTDKTANIWNLADGKLISTFKNHDQAVEVVAFAPNGGTVASAGKDKVIKIWNPQTGVEIKSFEAHPEAINALLFSEDGQNIISGDEDGTIQVINLATGLSRVLQASQKGIKALAISGDGERLAVGGEDRKLSIWDWRKGVSVEKPTRHLSEIYAVTFNPQNDQVASADKNGDLKVWQASPLQEISRFKRYTGPVTAVAFSPDGQWLATGHYDYWIRLWNTRGTGETRFLRGHGSAVNAICFSGDGEIMVSSGSDGVILVWDLTNDKVKHVLDDGTGKRHKISLSQNGKVLVSTGNDKKLRIWNVEKGQEITSGDVSSISNAVAISPDGSRVAVEDKGETIIIYEAQTGSTLRKLKSSETFFRQNLRFSPDGNFLVADDFDYEQNHCLIYVWDLRIKNNDQETFIFRAPSQNEHNSYQSLNFSRDGKLLAAGDEKGNLDVWDFISHRLLYSTEPHLGEIADLAFSPDGKFLVTSGGIDATTKIGEARTGKQLLTLICRTQSRNFVAVTPVGFFDGTLEDLNRVGWRFNRNTYDFAPLEAYFNEFLRPGLLAEIFAGNSNFKVKNLKLLDRTQPNVNLKIDNLQIPPENWPDRSAVIKIEVKIAPESGRKQRGVRDVRLFRNGILLEHWHGSVKIDAGGKALLTAIVPVSAGENRFTAYAFNENNIKSQDSRPLIIHGSEKLRRKGTLYIVSIGLKLYANPNYNLTYPQADAETAVADITKQQTDLKRWGAIKPFLLVNTDATKKNILAVLNKIAGQHTLLDQNASKNLRAAFEEITVTEPEDGIIIFYSGHGETTPDGRFFLIPHDFVKLNQNSKVFNQTSRASSISDLELADAFEGIKAERQALIIDACYAGKFLETGDIRRAPINQTGLAQLAFDKGIAILAAAQGSQKAREDNGLEHGLLTYILFKKGLEQAAADDLQQDGQVELREWFDFAVREVPRLPAVASQPCKDIKRCRLEDVAMQRPQSFYRENSNFDAFYVARLPNAFKTYNQDGISFFYPTGTELTRTPSLNNYSQKFVLRALNTSASIEFNITGTLAEISEQVLQIIKNGLDKEVKDEKESFESRGREVEITQKRVLIAGLETDFVTLTASQDGRPDEEVHFGWFKQNNRIVLIRFYRSLRTKDEQNMNWRDGIYQSLTIN
jgi:WD40 repeat protein/uncharacterized caspase-like protein